MSDLRSLSDALAGLERTLESGGAASWSTLVSAGRRVIDARDAAGSIVVPQPAVAFAAIHLESADHGYTNDLVARARSDSEAFRAQAAMRRLWAEQVDVAILTAERVPFALVWTGPSGDRLVMPPTMWQPRRHPTTGTPVGYGDEASGVGRCTAYPGRVSLIIPEVLG